MTTVRAPSAGRRSWPLPLWRIDKWLSRAGDWLNPILVKEARQALKSRQFIMTFGLLLLAVWGWTAVSVTVLQSGSGGSRATLSVFGGYFFILDIPLMVVIPFGAFRSLAAERDDGTYELVSITALSARQIVTGKLGSALLQVMVFFSVVAPCIAFTYMLRGIELMALVFVLSYTVMFSIALISLGLLMAASVRSIHWQILMSVMVLAGLAVAGLLWPAFVMDEVMDGRVPFDNRDFWVANGFAVSMLAVFTWFHLAAASAELSFPSDNRSTKLRVLMMVISGTFVAWMIYFYRQFSEPRLAITMGLGCVFFWWFMGALLTGENPELSPRVRRTLPRSLLGRMAFTWFNPGSASGYMFAVTNQLAVAAAVLVCWSAAWKSNQVLRSNEVAAVMLATSYMIIYLGLGRMCILGLRRLATFGVVVGLLVQALVAALAVVLPLMLQSILYWNQPGFRYTILQLPNWALSIPSMMFRRADVQGYSMFVYAAAIIVFVVNTVTATGEVRQLWLETPERVREDDAELHPVPAAEPPPKGPFD